MAGIEQRIRSEIPDEKVIELFSKINLGYLRPGLPARAYKPLKRRDGPYGTTTGDLIKVLSEPDWEAYFSNVEQFGPTGLNNLQAFYSYIKHIDSNFPEGVPPKTFKIKAEGNDLSIVGESPCLLPIF